jgi:hypothetical protein
VSADKKESDRCGFSWRFETSTKEERRGSETFGNDLDFSNSGEIRSDAPAWLGLKFLRKNGGGGGGGTNRGRGAVKRIKSMRFSGKFGSGVTPVLDEQRESGGRG